MTEHEFVAPIPDPTGGRSLQGTRPPFQGRNAELAKLTKLVNRGTPLPIVISGAAGVGKTSLVLHWAESNASRIDGQLIILHATRLPMRRILTELGVAHAAVPEGLSAQLQLYREVVGTRRVLVVLDGIEDPAPVCRLLSGMQGSTVLITSRVAPRNAVTLELGPVSYARHSRVSAWGTVGTVGMALLDWLRASPGLNISLNTITALTPGVRSAMLAIVELITTGLVEKRGYRLRALVQRRTQPQESQIEHGVFSPRRIAECYVCTAIDADKLLSPLRPPQVIPRAAEIAREPIADARAALAWFDAEHANLLTIQQLCLQETWFEEAWQLAWALETYHRRRGLLRDPATTWRSAINTALLLEDDVGLSVARQALVDLEDQVGEATWEVVALEGIAAVNAELGDFEGARLNWNRAQDLRRGPVTEVTVYTSDNVGEPLRDAVVELLQVAGFAVVGKDTPIRGSWFQRLRVRGDDQAVDKLGELAGKLERAAELKYIATPRSENDEREANAIAKLAEAMKDVDEVVIRTSSVLFVKTAGCVMSIVLSEEQIRCLDRNPQLMQAPAKVLDALAELVRGEPVPLAVEGQTG
ncbi:MULTISPECIES: ATP-binding protein [unclassified Crossiella]|uniref:ATP-binding protein n=1 Tax=unclassified Crossiella TaxID=2620835 RepID=UPI001FFFDA57|nr:MULTISPECIES: ATP-binding protein [unclassified Crossiella]MCK2239195.1 ATP-binding protein [Crossiella sp. S99.2]MCK2251236.1 ATP-binding protein [Crossiella sp. S99.1]